MNNGGPICQTVIFPAKNEEISFSKKQRERTVTFTFSSQRRSKSEVFKERGTDGYEGGWSPHDELEFAQREAVCWQREVGEVPSSELKHFLLAQGLVSIGWRRWRRI